MKVSHGLEQLTPECNGTICPAELIVVNCEHGDIVRGGDDMKYTIIVTQTEEKSIVGECVYP
jgi:hypothetical protein